PRAPRSEPDEIAFAVESISGFSMAFTSFAADIIVSVILVPVSPSGTGNTFSSLMYSFFASRFAAPARNIFLSISVFIVLTATTKSSLIYHSHTFNEDVDLIHRHASKFFYLILYIAHLFFVERK